MSTANPRQTAPPGHPGCFAAVACCYSSATDVWRVFDTWLSELSAETFRGNAATLCAARSADFSSAERRQMGDKVKHVRSAPQRQNLAPTMKTSIKSAAGGHCRSSLISWESSDGRHSPMTNGCGAGGLVLGESSQCHGGGAGAGADGLPIELMDDDAQMDKVLGPFTTPTAPPDWAARART